MYIQNAFEKSTDQLSAFVQYAKTQSHTVQSVAVMVKRMHQDVTCLCMPVERSPPFEFLKRHPVVCILKNILKNT